MAYPDWVGKRKDITGFLMSLGANREKLVTFMNRFTSGSEHILFDVTNIISKSNEMEINRLGYNSHKQYDLRLICSMLLHARAECRCITVFFPEIYVRYLH